MAGQPVARTLRYAGCAGTPLITDRGPCNQIPAASLDMKLLSRKLNRRFFLSLLSLSTTATILPSKVFGLSDYRRDKNIPKQYIQNRDRPGFFIRSANPFMGVDANDWGLSISGMVAKPTALAYEDLFGFKVISQVSRLKCVECWSATAQWEGFRFQELVDRVKPDPKAKYVYFQSADSYYESYTLEELLRPRVLMVIRMNGQPLSKDHGFPLRLIAPFKYGYKNVKYITSIEFTDSRKRNYWANNGPYSVDGTIQPGIDHPLDFNKKPLPINGGEVFHPFDKRPS
ncbi:MAG: molybdopterin-dependent oxidoreductase [Nitrospinaceae bacterium]|nr:molybdopterin-dependent oxidoreductase [Nitrospinaceae bacterium]